MRQSIRAEGVVSIDLACIDGFQLLLLFLRDVLEETIPEKSDCAAEKDRCEDDQCEACGDDDTAVGKRVVDTQHQTKGNSTADKPSVPNESQLFPGDLLGIVLLILAALEEADESEGAKATPDKDDEEFDNDELAAPLESLVREEGQAEVAEHETLCKESDELEDHHRALLSLR